MNHLLAKLAVVIISGAAVLAGYFGIATKNDIPSIPPTPAPIIQVIEEPLGAQIPIVISLFETSLQSSISSSDTSMTLVSGTDRAGTSLSGHMCFTIDEGTSVAEFVCGTASSTSVTSLTRGVSPLTGTSTVTSLKFSHRRGASVKITDYPQLAILSRVMNGDETFPNRIAYDSSIATSTFTTYNLINKQYADGIALQGAPTATTTTAGVVKFATATQLSSGTIGDGSYFYVPSVAQFNYTPQSATSVPVSNASGKIAQGWLNLTESFTFTGAVTHSATTTLAATSTAPLILRGVTYNFPASQGTASSTLVNNGSGTLIWSNTLTSLGTATAAPISITVPGGVLGVGKGIHVKAYITSTSGNNSDTFQFNLTYGGTTVSTVTFTNSGSSGATTATGIVDATLYATSTTAAVEGVIAASMGTTILNGQQGTQAAFGAIAKDTTSAQALSISTGGTGTITLRNAYFEIIR